jgi:hypothetical protein
VQAAEPGQDLPAEQRSPDLFGAWLIESIAAPDPALQSSSWDTVLLVGLRQLEAHSQCITFGPFEYGRTAGGGITVSLQPVRPRSGPAGGPPTVQCARGRSPAEQALPRVLLAATEVKARGGKIILSGSAGTMILRRPEGALRNPRGEAPPPATPPWLGAWRFTTVDKHPLRADERIELLLRANRLEWRSGCVGEAREVRIDRDLVRPGEVDPFPVCERGRSQAELALDRLFARPVVTRMDANGRLMLEGAGATAELEPLTS